MTGTLAPELMYSVKRSGAGQTSWTGSLKSLEQGLVVDDDLPAGTTVSCTMSEVLPREAGNQWEGTTASFEETFTLMGNSSSNGGAAPVGPSAVPLGGSTVVVPAEPGTPTHTHGALAFTGVKTYAPIAAALGCLALGLALAIVSRRRRFPPAAQRRRRLRRRQV